MTWEETRDVVGAFGAGAANLPIDVGYYAGLGANSAMHWAGLRNLAVTQQSYKDLDQWRKNPTPFPEVNAYRKHVMEQNPNVFTAGEIIGPAIVARGLKKLGKYVLSNKALAAGKASAFEFGAEPAMDKMFKVENTQ